MEIELTSALKGLGSRILVGLAVLTGLGSVQAATVAYWRFETGPDGGWVEHGGRAGFFQGSTPDDSGNGNTLSAWTQGGAGGYVYRTDVPFAALPSDGTVNRFSVQNTGPEPRLFTSAAGSVPSGINAQTITPLQFTVEASYKPEANGGYRTVVGRDALNVSNSDPQLAALYLQVRPDDSVGVTFTDVAGYTHRAYSYPGLIYGFDYGLDPEGGGAPWYRLVAVSDGLTLKMYVDNALVASTDLELSGSPNRSLAIGATQRADYIAGGWTVGRGLYGGVHTDFAYGLIDEVRISDSALAPEAFLSTFRPQLGGGARADGWLGFEVWRGEPGSSWVVLQSVNPLAAFANWRAIETHTFGADGRFAFSTPVRPGTARQFFALRAAIPMPVQGPLTYSLAPGAERWPADIRERIRYAMEGAVALYNKYGSFPKHLTANYNPGVPTAQAGYNGWIDFGGQIGYRTALHEISHTLGIGTVWNWSSFVQGGQWTGVQALRQVRVFDGPNATLGADGAHYWPYGLNYETEGSTENNRRHVLMDAAFRRDLGIE